MRKSSIRWVRIVLLTSFILFVFLISVPGTTPLRAVGESSTKFGIFVPPNGENSGRDPALIVTALQNATAVDIIDDNGDGDNDDSATGLILNAGQSYIIYIEEGAVNDDIEGIADGDYFRITSSKPVIIANLTVNTDWQHDFLPADNRRMSGTSFYLYRPVGFTNAHGRNELINIFAYNDNTDIEIIDITDTAHTSSGATSVVSDAAGSSIFTYTLNSGEDLLEVHNQHLNLPAGHTFHILSNKDITVQFGSLGKAATGSRDGGTYVPGKNGFSADKTFYFVIPYRYAGEREMRLVSYGKPANVVVRGWNTGTGEWDDLAGIYLPKFGHDELVGNELGEDYYFFEVTADATISVFETSWLETGNFGTSDIMTFISSSTGIGAGTEFLAYMGPPGNKPGGQFSHLYVYAYQETTGYAYDPDSYGEYIELYNNSGQSIDLAGWRLTNGEGWSVTLPKGLSVAAGNTFLLEFHEDATIAPADFVYGGEFPKFKLGNGTEHIRLYDDQGVLIDEVAYAAEGWGSHGVYYALERVDADAPFTAVNSQDSTVYVNRSSSNLGSYYGTPGVLQTGGGSGSGSLVINELMSGRIYQPFSIAADDYVDIMLTVDEWLGIHNGEAPGANNEPENPYLIVETDAPVSVMNANWNDNWMAYGTGTLQPDPTVNHTANYYERIPGETVYFSTYVSNEFNTLYAPETTVTLPAGIRYQPGQYSTPVQISGVTPVEQQLADGSWTISWTHDVPLDKGDIYLFQVWGALDNGLSADTLLQSTAVANGEDLIGSDYATLDSAVVNVGAIDEPAVVREVVINEILPNPSCGYEWIEIHNLSTNDINIGGWELADEDGFIYRFPEYTFIPNDGYLVLYLGDGVDGDGELYTGAAFAHALGDTEDQVSLYSGAAHNVETLIDFVQWSSGAVLDGTDDDLAVSAEIWSDGAFVPAPPRDVSIGRDRAASDSDGPGDWDNSGGPDAAVTTPGALNVSIPGADDTPPGAVAQLQTAAVPDQQGAVRLEWQNPPDGDFAGVRIIRSGSGHPDGLFDGQLVYDGIVNSFVDTGLTPGEPAFYTVYAYDDAGNLSCPQADAPTQVMPTQSVFIAFEDMKGWSWVDWDMNDLIVRQDTAVQLAGDLVSQIDIRMELMARGGMFDHALNLTVDFHDRATVTVRFFDAAGMQTDVRRMSAIDGVTVPLFSSTLAAMPPNDAASGTTNAVRGSGLTVGPSARVTIDLFTPAENPLSSLQTLPFDPWIRVKNTGFTIHLQETGGVGNTQFANTGPLYGRDLPYGLLFTDAWSWPAEAVPIWNAYPEFAGFVTSGEAANLSWAAQPEEALLWSADAPRDRPAVTGLNRLQTSNLANNQPVVTANSQTGWPRMVGEILFSSPLILDLDGDGDNELITAAQNNRVYVWEADGTDSPGWPRNAGGMVRSSPAVGDLDGDGDRELIIGADNGELLAWHHTGELVTGYPVLLEDKVRATPVLANLDGDDALELVVLTTAPRLYVLDDDGTVFPEWPQTLGGEPFLYGNQIISATPAVADMDGDGEAEIAVGSTDGRVYAFHLDGTPVSPLWPRQTGDWIYAAPLLVDLNEDGYRDLIAASGDGKLYAWRGEGTILPGFPLDLGTPLFASPAVVDLDGDDDLELIAATLTGDLFAFHHDGRPVFNWPRSVSADIYASPIAGDIDGDADPEIIAAAVDGSVYAWHHDGIPVVDFPLQTGDWIVATPTVGDLDRDGDVDIAAGSYDGFIYVWDQPGTYAPENMAWTTLGGDETHTSYQPTDTPIQPLPEVRFSVYLPIILGDK